MPNRNRNNNRVPNKKRSMFAGLLNRRPEGGNIPVKVSNSKNTNNISTKDTKTETFEMKGPGIVDSVKTGFGFGIGSSIAHTGVNAVTNSLGGVQKEPTKDLGNNGIITNDLDNSSKETMSCTELFNQYSNCLKLYNRNDWDDKLLRIECMEIKNLIDKLKCGDNLMTKLKPEEIIRDYDLNL